MEVRHLELLRELSVRGTLAAVAAATYRTPSAVSQQLATAERAAGVALTEASARGVRLTEHGQILADGAQEVLTALSAVQARLDTATGRPQGVVRIGTLPSAGQVLLPPLVRHLQTSPIRLELDDFDLAEADYAARTLDADIVIGHSLTSDVPAGAQDLTNRVLAREPLDVAIPQGHRLAGKVYLDVEDLAGTTWVGVPRGYPFDDVLITVENLLGQSLYRRIRLRDNQLVGALVAAGYGLALLPRFTTAARPGVVLRELRGLSTVRNIIALSRPERHTRLAVRTVLDHLRSIGAEAEHRYAR